MVISLSGKVIGDAYCARSGVPTSPSARVSGCTRREAEEQPLSVHHGRCFPAGQKGPWSDRHCISTFQRPNAVDTSGMTRTTRPPGARMAMIYVSLAIMSGVACVGAHPRRPMRVAYNNGVVLVFRCRLFSASLPKGIFWSLMGVGTAQCVLAHLCDSPPRGVEDLPRATTRTPPIRSMPQTTQSPQGTPPVL